MFMDIKNVVKKVKNMVIKKMPIDIENKVNTITDKFSLFENNFNLLDVSVERLSKDLAKIENEVDGVNQKTQLLFNQINNTNKIISAYVKEQLFNLERLRLECKRENLTHIIEEEFIEKTMAWLFTIPWYKKITKKQKQNVIAGVELIRAEIEAKYKTKMDEVMYEINNHTRENFFEKLNRVTSDLKGKKNAE